MSERLPYEDHLQQHWADLPLPDENKAWEDMRRRLEEDDDDRPIIAWWRRGCLLWGLLLLVIFGSGLWLIWKKYFTSDDNKKVTVNKQDKRSDKKRNDTVIIQTIPSNTGGGSGGEIIKDETGPLKEVTGVRQPDPVDDPTTVNNPEKERDSSITSQQKGNQLKPGTEIQHPEVTGRRRNRSISARNNNNISNPIVTGQRRRVINAPRKLVTEPLSPSKNNTDKKNKAPDQPERISEQNGVAKTNLPVVTNGNDTSAVKPVKDSSSIKAPDEKDSVVAVKPNKQDSLSGNTAKKDSAKKKQLSYSAGISMQQLLPVAGQKTVPYNSQGRKGTLADYIPSIYFRVNKEQKWFIQGEFRYGAPQYTKEFVYKENRREDTTGGQTFTTRSSNTLKKTYYHQLPVTFNYFIKKDWSVGGGLSWNKFVSAISDREVTRRDNSTAQDSLVSKGIIREKSDSASGFAKSYFQGVIESQYKWKRFSFGARYTFGLQPYLKFTLLNGETGKESNRSLQIFLRYEIWKSKKKE